MSIAATNDRIYALLTEALRNINGTEIMAHQGVQEKDDEAKLETPTVIYQRVGSDEGQTLDNAPHLNSVSYNLILVNETAELVTDMEDAIRNHFGKEEPGASFFGGQDLLPRSEDEGFVRLIAVQMIAQGASDG